MPASDPSMSADTLVPGLAQGMALKLTEPLNAWGGLDPMTGVIVHHSHSQRGRSLAGRILVMHQSRGSGTNAQVFAQALANGTGPLAVVLAAPDHVLCAGVVVSRELYGVQCPVVVLGIGYDAIGDGDAIVVDARDEYATVTIRSGARIQRRAEPAIDDDRGAVDE